MTFDEVMEVVAKAFEATGAAIIVVGGVHTLIRALRSVGEDSVYTDARKRFGRPLILGLEVLVAADIILTITVDRSLESIVTLGVLVLIRIALSTSLEVEVDGMLPWQRARLERLDSVPDTPSAPE